MSYEPAAVFERNRTEGPSVIGYGGPVWPPIGVIQKLQEDFSTLPDPDPKVLLSMEIFAGARLEASQRAVYLALVSALEPLAEVKPLSAEVDAFVQQSITALHSVAALSEETRNSLEGRLNQLRHESIRQALIRFVRETIPDNVDASHAIDEAYALRSQLIHKGQPEDLDIDLDSEIAIVSSLVQSIYVKLLRRL